MKQKTILAISLIVIYLPLVLLGNVLAVPLADTGQTKCYDDNGIEISPCPLPGDPFYGQDAQYISIPQSYTKLDEDGNDLPDDAPWPWAMVRDNVTGLIWEVKTDDGSIHDKDNIYNWYDAQDVFMTNLNSQNFGGFSDWRLPTLKELTSIVNRSLLDPCTDDAYFPNIGLLYFHWSSSSYLYSFSVHAWVLNFYFAQVMVHHKSIVKNYVRAVRGGQCGATGIFIDNDDGTITDTKTGLMWQKVYSIEKITWEEALSYCENLQLAGYDDWRLPNVNELESLADHSRFNPSIDPIFPDTRQERHWTSTTSVYDPSEAWLVWFTTGSIEDYAKTEPNYMRAVRGGHCEAYDDLDGDYCIDCFDNCPDNHNPNQEDSYPPQGNGIGDACDCEADFDCNGNVDALDVVNFLLDFGRGGYYDPCTNDRWCYGDFDCNGSVDADDVSKFLEDFGRGQYSNTCPACEVGDWCVYP